MNDHIIVRGFSKIGTVVQDDPADSVLVVEFERVRIQVDRVTKNIILSKDCVKIVD